MRPDVGCNFTILTPAQNFFRRRLGLLSKFFDIFCVRVNSITSPLPSCVRAITFGCLARIVCVSVPDKPEPTNIIDDSHSVTSNSTAARVVYVPADRTSTIRSATNSPTDKRPHLSAANSTSVHAGPVTWHDGSTCGHSPQASCCCQYQLRTQVDKLLRELRKITHRQQSREQEESMADEWRTLAVVLDRLLLGVSVVVLVVFAIYMSVVSHSSPHLHPDAVLVSLDDQRSEYDV